MPITAKKQSIHRHNREIKIMHANRNTKISELDRKSEEK